MTTTPQLGITRLTEGQSGGEITANGAINVLDAFIQLSIKDRDLATPPGSPAEGDRYLVAASPTGAWTGQAGMIAVYFAGWLFFSPKEGWFTWIDDENIFIRYNGSAWVEAALVTKQTKSITVLNPTNAENATLFYTTVAITIVKAVAVLRGSASPSVTYEIRHHTDRSNAGNALFSAAQVVTNTTTGAIVTSFGGGDPTVPAQSFIWFDTTAKSGTVNEINVTLEYRED